MIFHFLDLINLIVYFQPLYLLLTEIPPQGSPIIVGNVRKFDSPWAKAFQNFPNKLIRVDKNHGETHFTLQLDALRPNQKSDAVYQIS